MYVCSIEDALADHDSNVLSLQDRARKGKLEAEQEEAEVKVRPSPLHGTSVYARRTHTRPQKVEAIVNMPRADDKRAVQRLLGCEIYLSRFMPTLSENQQIKQCTVADAALQSLMNTIMTGWPQTKEEFPVCSHKYCNYKEKLIVQGRVLFKGMKVIVPNSMRPQMIARVHSSHLGPDACVRRARDVLFWLGMVVQTKDQVQRCEVCNDLLARHQKEPLMTDKIIETP